jgi:anti-sigma factor RsiW
MSRHATAAQLSAYLDEELPPPQLRLVEDHLEECPDCRRELEGLRGVVRRLRRLEELAPPPALGQDLARRIRLEPQPRDLLQRLEGRIQNTPMQSTVGFTFALVFALAVILFLFVNWVDERRQAHQPVLVAPSEILDAEDFTLPEEPLPTRTVSAASEEARRWIETAPELGRLLDRGVSVTWTWEGEVVEIVPVTAGDGEVAQGASEGE